MILLDTHVLLWLAAEPARLSKAAASAIRRALRSGGIAIASITLWEIVVMFAKGRLRSRGTAEASLEAILTGTGVSVREITPTIATLATQFPADFPADPADRLIAATARAEGFVLVTRDDRIRSSALLRTVW
ncbi:MAG TPA: type II toxin-antitoxin system VapC family toxin [Thermoanaerobaculia bacterium]